MRRAHVKIIALVSAGRACPGGAHPAVVQGCIQRVRVAAVR
ncbi:hypothetical protein [Actinomadura craniellae]|nr:hypothetical protein [Actinomadura craniellae]